MKTLFPYQNDARDESVKAVKQQLPAALIVMATGLGKTVVASSFVRWWTRTKKSQILFLVHLWEAVDQAEKEFAEMLPQAKFQFLIGSERLDRSAQVVFSTFQTMRNQYRSIPRDTFGLIVVDECHRSKADTYEPIVEYFHPEFKLAMTATEERMDGRDVRELFGDPVYEYPLALALANHNLADVEYRVLVDNISQATLRHIEKLLGRGEGMVTRTMIDRKVFLAERLHLIARTIKREQKTRVKTIIFCNSRRHASAVKDHFPEAKTYFSGLPKEVLKERLRAFKSGTVPTLIVVNKLNEAIDVPDADLIVFLRTTESKTIWLQQLGRGLRKNHGKKDVLVLDFAANCDRVRIVGQLAGDVRKYLGISGESTEIHQTGLTFNFESEARNIFELLERVENLPQAGKDGTFRHGGDVWGTVSALSAILKIADPAIASRISSHQIKEMSGKDRNGRIGKFYPISKVRAAFGKMLELPRTEGAGMLVIDGETWGMAHTLANYLGLSAPTIERHKATYRKREVFATNGIAVFYALSDVRKACADLLRIPKAGRNGTFKLRGETWGTAPTIGKILRLSEWLVRRHTPARLTIKAKDVQGKLCPFYPLSKVKRFCAHFNKMPRARKDGIYIKDGHKWATLKTMVRLFGITWRSIKNRVSSCRRMKGKDFYGQPVELYLISEAEKACSDLLKPLPQAGRNGTFKYRGEVWGSTYALGRILGVSSPTVRSRESSCRTMEGKNPSGGVSKFYALADVRKACKKVQRWKGKRK